MKTSPMKITQLTMLFISLATLACSDGVSDKASKFCEKYPENLNVLLNDITDEFDFGNLLNENKCETFFKNLTFCESELIDVLSTSADCAFIEAECSRPLDTCEAMEESCYSIYESCEAGSNCFDEFYTCLDDSEKCFDDVYDNDEYEKCYERAEECYENGKFDLKIAKVALCIDENYSPSSSLNQFCASQASSCGFENTDACVNYLQSGFGEDGSISAESVDAITSLASCALKHLNIQCSDLFQLMDEDNFEDFNESEIESMISQVSNIFFHCPNDILGLTITFTGL